MTRLDINIYFIETAGKRVWSILIPPPRSYPLARGTPWKMYEIPGFINGLWFHVGGSKDSVIGVIDSCIPIEIPILLLTPRVSTRHPLKSCMLLIIGSQIS